MNAQVSGPPWAVKWKNVAWCVKEMDHLEQRQYFLAEVVVKVGVFGIAHVVDENQTGALSVDAFQGHIQLVHHSLQRAK